MYSLRMLCACVDLAVMDVHCRRTARAPICMHTLRAHVERATDPSPSPFSPEGNLMQIKSRAHCRELLINMSQRRMCHSGSMVRVLISSIVCFKKEWTYCKTTNFRTRLIFVKFVSGANLLKLVFTKISLY